MEISAPITIYNASAGSGKTFTLVQLFLEKLLSSGNPDAYKNFLAITFTNKAVAEMKKRIIDTLVSFSEEESLTNPPKMLQKIAKRTEISIETLQLRAKKSLKHLLHNYAQFSVETIDHFNHRLIRTFARDLKLPAHFEVSLDVPLLLSEAVDNLINKAGEDIEITKVLVAFALHKTDEDKSWDITYDLLTTTSLLLNENDAAYLQQFKTTTLTDFQTLKATLTKKRNSHFATLKDLAKNTLQIIEEAGLEKTDFNGGSRAYFPSYLEKIANENLSVAFGAAWQTSMGEKPMYPKSKTTDAIAQTIDALTDQFVAVFLQSKELVVEIKLLDNILKNLTPLSVINLVQLELQNLKEEQNVLPISEFNALINEEIKDQPAPFIYERLGDRYRHFFIDEFQDTSLLQWQNLIPLIDNAVSQEYEGTSPGSVLLVGDAKQAIYRWRGGLPEQFIDLYSEKAIPFSNPNVAIENLDTNWRSHEQIVSFNNSFFSFLANRFGNSMHQNLYEIGNRQKTNSKSEGYVQLEFITAADKEDANEQYGRCVLNTIQNLTDGKYAPEDICILTRTKKDGVAISTYLMEAGIHVVSAETLLVNSSALVQFLVNGLTLALYPDNDMVKVSWLDFLHGHFNIPTAKHDFLEACLTKNDTSLNELLSEYQITVNLATLTTLSLYQAFEYLIKQCKLYTVADAYLFAFMDIVLEFETQPQASKLNFLDYWESKKEKASIPSEGMKDAVTVMTIHKSKGLEFPIVLYPYANTKLYAEQNAKAWFPLNEGGFGDALINFSKEVEHFGAVGQALFSDRRNTLELDNINLLYVVLTRAVEQLYVYSEIPSKISIEQPDDFRQLLIAYLSANNLWNPDQLRYSFGDFKATCNLASKEKKRDEVVVVTPSYISSSPEEHQLRIASSEASLWQTDAEAAIDLGNLVHDTMEHIRTKNDIKTVFASYRERALYPEDTITYLESVVVNIVQHPDVMHLFSDELTPSSIINERDIVTSTQELLRPDRLNFFDDNTVTITDYKTGTENTKHNRQLEIYGKTLQDMGYEIAEKILIYSHGASISINKI